jgi:hypothetical protein
LFSLAMILIAAGWIFLSEKSYPALPLMFTGLAINAVLGATRLRS